MNSLALNYAAVQKQISSFSVSLIAVSKTQCVSAIEELYHLGQRDFGENYVHELRKKAELLTQKGYTDIRWHFLGHLQSNKIKELLPYVACIHTIDSPKLAQSIAKRWANTAQPLPIFIQININHEPTKSGLYPAQTRALAEQVHQLPELSLQGLMCIPDPQRDPRANFIQLRKLGEEISAFSQGMLSMGMSSDYLIALAEGATHIRLGTTLFGPRH